MHYISHYRSPLGGTTMASNGEALTGLWFDGQQHFASTLSCQYQEKDLSIFDKTKEWLNIYFSGRNPNFTPPISLEGTPFWKQVWEMLTRIPYGQVTTYRALAQAIAQERGLAQMAAQAVGGAVGHNPISIIIPCHRVVGSDGSLTGYAGGIDKKLKLLKLENANYGQ